jgi:hypothetical protein
LLKTQYQILPVKKYSIIKGGPGSGHFAHAGRPGEVGGSDGEEGGGGSTLVSDKNAKRFAFAADNEQVITREMELDVYKKTLIRGMNERLGNGEITLISKAVAEYSGGSYKSMRTALVTGKEKLSSGKELTSMEKQALVLNQVCSSSTVNVSTLHRGLAWNDMEKMNSFVDAVKSGNGIKLESITSFSTNKNVAISFTKGKAYSVSIRINNSGSLKGLNLSNISYAPNESESLLASGQSLGLKSISQRTGGYDIELEAK